MINEDAPIDMLAPEAAYTVFYAIFIVSLAATLIWLVWHAARTRSWLPVAAIVGALAISAFTPPIYNALTKVWFPSNIPFPFVTAFGMNDPVFDLIGTALFMGVGGYCLMRWLQVGGGAKAIWVTFLIWAASDLILEVPFLRWGLYAYFGDQQLLIFGFPIHWVVMNGLAPVLSGSMMYVVGQVFAGRRWSLIIGTAVSPAVGLAVLMLPIFPVATTLYADVPSLVRLGGSVLCIAICFCFMILLSRWAQSEAERYRTRQGPAADTRISAPTSASPLAGPA